MFYKGLCLFLTLQDWPNIYFSVSALDLKSQLLFLSCKKIYVAVERQSNEELEELRKNPSRYKSPERQIAIARPRSPSVERVSITPTIENRSTPIVIDLIDDDDEEENPVIAIDDDEVPPVVSTPPSRPLPLPYVSLSPPIAVAQPQRIQLPNSTIPSRIVTFTPLMPHSQQQPILFQPTITGRRSFAAVAPMVRSPPAKRPRSEIDKRSNKANSSNSVVVVDLCSSDEEEDDAKIEKRKNIVSDEVEQIRDENLHQEQRRLSNIMSLGPSKLISKPCIYPADSTSNCLPSSESNRFIQQHHGSSMHRSNPWRNDSFVVTMATNVNY